MNDQIVWQRGAGGTAGTGEAPAADATGGPTQVLRRELWVGERYLTRDSP